MGLYQFVWRAWWTRRARKNMARLGFVFRDNSWRSWWKASDYAWLDKEVRNNG